MWNELKHGRSNFGNHQEKLYLLLYVNFLLQLQLHSTFVLKLSLSNLQGLGRPESFKSASLWDTKSRFVENSIGFNGTRVTRSL